MGKIIYAEEKLLDYLTNLTTSSTSSIGLIIGQSSKSKSYVVHMARTMQDVDDVTEAPDSIEAYTFNSVKDIDEGVISDHAKHVTRMLPGGFNVLGAFICTPTSIFNNSQAESTLKRLLGCVKKALSTEPYLETGNELEYIILHFNPTDQKYLCKSLDVNNTSMSIFKSVDWKFQNNCTKWCQICSKFDINWPSIGGNTSQQLKTQLKNFLEDVSTLLDPAIVAIDGKIHSLNDTLESLLDKNKKANTINPVEHLEAYIFTPIKDSSNDDIVVVDCDVELHLMGVLRSQVFITEKGTIEDAISAVKQDIVRSLASRLEMHWDSLIEEEYGSPEEKQTVHEPPRRVSISIPNTSLCFSDYIFPGEGAHEVIATCKELLDIYITEDDVNEEYEIHGDPSDLCGESPKSSTYSTPDDLLWSTWPNGFLIAAVSLTVLLTGILIALHIQKNSSLEKNI